MRENVDYLCAYRTSVAPFRGLGVIFIKLFKQWNFTKKILRQLSKN